MPGSIIVRQPEAPRELVLLFHGVGQVPTSMLPLAQLIAEARPSAFVVCIEAAHPSDMGHGRQWFSVRGITEDDRPERIAEAMPAFDDTVRGWQARSGLGVHDTALVGFSQGAIMSLETLPREEALAGRVVAIAGRFAKPPARIASGVQVNIVHGSDDPVIDPKYAVETRAQLQLFGAPVTMDFVQGLGHNIDEQVIGHVTARLAER